LLESPFQDFPPASVETKSDVNETMNQECEKYLQFHAYCIKVIRSARPWWFLDIGQGRAKLLVNQLTLYIFLLI
jgi:hypothetical protein